MESIEQKLFADAREKCVKFATETGLHLNFKLCQIINIEKT